MSYVIRYRYPGTVSRADGKQHPVGLVYATGPHFGQDVWSHTYDPAKAATWRSYDEANAASGKWRKDEAIVVPLADAEVLA